MEAFIIKLNVMENYNETSRNGNRQNDQMDPQRANRNQIRNEQENQSQSNRDKNQNNQESQSQNNNMAQQEGQTKRPVYIKDMPEIKPETNQGGI